MLESTDELTFRSAQPDDLAKIIELVEEHDDDDAEAVQESLAEVDFTNHFVALINHTVVGITGFYQQPDCDNTYYLSWTYLKKSECGKGYGNQMMTFIIDKFKEIGARQVFVKISDYVDPEDGPVYAAALSLYKKFGFQEAIKFEDYYDTNESMYILSLVLKEAPEFTFQKSEKPCLKFTGMFPIPETEHSYSFEWQAGKWWQGNFSVQDIYIGLDAAYEEGAHQVFISFPSTYEKINTTLETAGFHLLGSLENYYEDGVHECHYYFDFRKHKQNNND